KVIREGNIEVIDAENIVPYDLIILESGDRIPADGNLYNVNSLIVDESILTGESVGVNKSNIDPVYMGTLVLAGKGLAQVSKTGMRTEMGKIADMLSEITEDRSPLKEKLAQLGKILVIGCIVICIIVTIMGIIRGEDKYQMFLLGVSLAVAAIPEGLPAIVTVALALGVSRMLKRNALVRKLPAVETLGCVSVICSDKTGTLTENKMTAVCIYDNRKEYKINENFNGKEQIKKAALLCNECQAGDKDIIGEPTEKAIVNFFIGNVKELTEFKNKFPIIDEIPFNSDRKMMTVITKENSKYCYYVKGAPERLLMKSDKILINGKAEIFTGNIKSKINNEIDKMSSDALRLIGFGYKEENKHTKDEDDLIFIGIIGIIDPPRSEVKEAVKECIKAGITPVMITGDYINTAYAIGKEIGICDNIDECIEGKDIDLLTDKEFRKVIPKIKIFARLNPKNKLKIIKAYKDLGKIVAMTGDGVNDAPAVKEADIGISMGISGTDVTKEASSMILLDDNFATIVNAVKEGRVIYDNIKKFIRYLLSCNLGEVLTMFLASLFYLKIPLLPIQILFINLATDGLPALALGLDPAGTDIMKKAPRDKSTGIFSEGLGERIFVRGTLIGICTILSFITGMYYNFSLECCRTITMATLVMSQLFHVFECRSLNKSIFEIKIFTNMYLFFAVFISVIMLTSILYLPFFRLIFHTVYLDSGKWLIVIFYSGIISLINSLYLLIKKTV
ncbi:MAG: calcium-translocating P-type ATPase, PMCA-type, partial [Bacillota bacterium]|nr:calcium-translocating P-type ATPase, PMCA-type [Bacillota bacterium]